MQKILTSIISILLLLSCSKSINLKDYYYQLEDFKNSKIYKFQSKEDESKVEFWKISSDVEKNEIYITRLNKKMEIIDEMIEKINSNGVELKLYTLFDRNENKELKFNKFYPKKNTLLNWNINKKSVYEGEIILQGEILNVKREMEFVNQIEIEVNLKNYNVIVYKSYYEIKSLSNPIPEEEQWLYKRNYTQFSYYAKGIGIVKYERNYNNGTKSTMELVEIKSQIIANNQ